MKLAYNGAMKTKLILLIFISMMALNANEALVDRPKLPLEQSLPLLKTIQKEAIVFGTGAIEVHVFIDPICPRSRDFVSLVYENAKIKEKYRYHFYLYRLPRFKSTQLIETIYSAQDSRSTLIDVMVRKKEVPLQKAAAAIKRKIGTIAAVAQKVDVYKRPYLILVKKKRTK